MTPDRYRLAIDEAALVYEEVGRTSGWMSKAGLAASAAVQRQGHERLSCRERRFVCRTVEAIWRTHDLPSPEPR